MFKYGSGLGGDKNKDFLTKFEKQKTKGKQTVLEGQENELSFRWVVKTPVWHVTDKRSALDITEKGVRMSMNKEALGGSGGKRGNCFYTAWSLAGALGWAAGSGQNAWYPTVWAQAHHEYSQKVGGVDEVREGSQYEGTKQFRAALARALGAVRFEYIGPDVSVEVPGTMDGSEARFDGPVAEALLNNPGMVSRREEPDEEKLKWLPAELSVPEEYAARRIPEQGGNRFNGMVQHPDIPSPK
uniref:Uncharacterized protein n=1 Tax=Chromobacterium violaceum TaxID=536 RepID=A0A2R4K2P5_CHRVL|nr:hypothetical protein [Chromobacterium violaceum]AVV48129.1 hypothetical protein [Chromobacterium violaceum]